MKKKTQWTVIINQNPQLSPPRGQLRLAVDNTKSGPVDNFSNDFSDSIHLWTNTPIKTILKAIKKAVHPAELNALQKLTVNHSKSLEIRMALYEARTKLHKKGA